MAINFEVYCIDSRDAFKFLADILDRKLFIFLQSRKFIYGARLYYTTSVSAGEQYKYAKLIDILHERGMSTTTEPVKPGVYLSKQRPADSNSYASS